MRDGPSWSNEFSPLVLEDAAVAVIDALGFKGIWRRHEPAAIVSMLASLEAASTDSEANLNEHRVRDCASVRFFSDGVVVIVRDGGPRMSLALACNMVGQITAQALLSDVRFAYRGCISYGPILAQGSFYVGPAIDEAAEWAQQANAAVVWLAPSALEHLVHFRVPPEFFVEWEVPLKAGAVRKTLIVNPFPSLAASKVGDEEAVRRFRKTFGDAPSTDVAIKLEHTERALAVGREALRRNPSPTG